MSAFTHQSVKFQAVKGGKFQLFDGNITGEFIELVSKSTIINIDIYIYTHTLNYNVILTT